MGTDVDDKIIKKSIEQNKDIKSLTEVYISSMKKDMLNLNLINPKFEPRATDYIGKMIEFISKLIRKKIAFISKNGDICYDIKKYPEYVKLSCKNKRKKDAKN